MELLQTEVCALGTAIAAGVGAGIFKDAEEGVKKMTGEKEIFTPKPCNVEIYQDIYDNIYKKMYKTNESIYKRLKSYEKIELVK